MTSGSLILVAGPNGAGKTSVMTRLRVEGETGKYLKINADDRTLELLQAAGYQEFADVGEAELKRLFIQAADETYQQTVSELRGGVNVQIETVLSTSKYRELVTDVIDGGARFTLVYVALRSPETSLQRVTARVGKGGHPVPPERLAERWERSLRQLSWFASRSDAFLIFDNTNVNPEEPPLLIAKGSRASLHWCVDASLVFPELRQALSGEFPVESWPTAST